MPIRLIKSMEISSRGSVCGVVVITQLVDGKIKVLCAEKFERPEYNEMLQKT
jgi:hypothetical protein